MSDLPEVKPLTDADYSLSDLARMTQENKSLGSIVSASSVDNMKAFLVSYSKNQLGRILSLTDALAKAEAKLVSDMNATIDSADKDGKMVDPDYLLRVMGTIQNNLNNVMGTINQIIRDDSYMSLIIKEQTIINNQINNYQPGSASSAINLSADSREKVRGIVDSLMKKMDAPSGVVDAEYKEVPNEQISEIPAQKEE